jgi:hypothetical protein
MTESQVKPRSSWAYCAVLLYLKSFTTTGTTSYFHPNWDYIQPIKARQAKGRPCRYSSKILHLSGILTYLHMHSEHWQPIPFLFVLTCAQWALAASSPSFFCFTITISLHCSFLWVSHPHKMKIRYRSKVHSRSIVIGIMPEGENLFLSFSFSCNLAFTLTYGSTQHDYYCSWSMQCQKEREGTVKGPSDQIMDRLESGTIAKFLFWSYTSMCLKIELEY